MGTITKTAGVNFDGLVDGDWYTVKLVEIVPTSELTAEEQQFGPTTRFAVRVEDLPETGELRIYASNLLNDQPGGKPCKLRAVLNAINGKPVTTLISGVDDVTLVADYGGTKVEPKIGATFQASGEFDQAGNFRLRAFRAVTAARPVAVTSAPF